MQVFKHAGYLRLLECDRKYVSLWRRFLAFLAIRVFKFSGITLYPYVFVVDKIGVLLLPHEYFHLEQQRKLGLLRFLVSYCLEFVRNFFRYRSFMEAYRKISFEQIAYENSTPYRFFDYFGGKLEVIHKNS